MASKPASVPSWGTDTNFASGTETGTPVKVEPSSGYKAQGFVPGLAAVSSYLNWFMYWVYLWCAYLDDLEAQTLNWSVAQTFSSTLTATPSSGTNVTAITATGRGSLYGVLGTGGAASGTGVRGVGGASNGYGVSGLGDGTGAGGYFQGGDNAGNGVEGVAGAIGGHGVRGTGDNVGNGGRFTGGSVGDGVYGIGGASGGRGAYFEGTTTYSGVVCKGGPTNGIGVYGEGVGTGSGVEGVGGTSGVGVKGTGGNGATGAGVWGEGASGSDGYGVSGTGDGDGAGGRFYAGATGANIRLVARTGDPTAFQNGDVWFDGTDFKCRIGGVTKTFTVV